MQALCCLSRTLALGPGDQVPGEFTERLDASRNQGTRAQHGLETRQVERLGALKNACVAIADTCLQND